MAENQNIYSGLSEVGRLSLKFSKAVEIIQIKTGKNNSQIISDIINKRLGTKYKPANFTLFHDLHIKHPDSTSRSSKFKLTQITDLLDQLIEEYGLEYQDSGEYEKITDIHENARYDSFLGIYQGYSWDMTTSAANGEDYIHVFKVHVVSRKEIRCVTKNGTFQAKRMNIVGGNRISLELINDFRKLYLIVLIGNAGEEDLKRINSFKLAYTDSGTKNVKCGLAILNRMEGPFDSLQTESVPASEIDLAIVDFLRNQQLVLS